METEGNSLRGKRERRQSLKCRERDRLGIGCENLDMIVCENLIWSLIIILIIEVMIIVSQSV
jgi:hypothetical protein